MTPSAISHSIKVLEERLNVRLFNRTTRSVSLTEAGERFAAKLRPAVASIEEAVKDLEEMIRSRVEPYGSMPAKGLSGWYCGRCSHASCEYPQVHLDIVSDGRLSDIVADGFDAGIRLAEAVPKDMVAIPIMGEVRFAAVASPEYFERRGHPVLPRIYTATIASASGLKVEQFSDGNLNIWALSNGSTFPVLSH